MSSLNFSNPMTNLRFQLELLFDVPKASENSTLLEVLRMGKDSCARPESVYENIVELYSLLDDSQSLAIYHHADHFELFNPVFAELRDILSNLYPGYVVGKFERLRDVDWKVYRVVEDFLSTTLSGNDLSSEDIMFLERRLDLLATELERVEEWDIYQGGLPYYSISFSSSLRRYEQSGNDKLREMLLKMLGEVIVRELHNPLQPKTKELVADIAAVFLEGTQSLDTPRSTAELSDMIRTLLSDTFSFNEVIKKLESIHVNPSRKMTSD